MLPDLPYELHALECHISRETLSFHYGNHHAGYVKKLSKRVRDTGFADHTLEEIVQHATGEVFNNAAQAWNHDFYWHNLSPEGGGGPQEPRCSASR
jgi:Fe-Mn family superoxide dismutase